MSFMFSGLSSLFFVFLAVFSVFFGFLSWKGVQTNHRLYQSRYFVGSADFCGIAKLSDLCHSSICILVTVLTSLNLLMPLVLAIVEVCWSLGLGGRFSTKTSRKTMNCTATAKTPKPMQPRTVQRFPRLFWNSKAS